MTTPVNTEAALAQLRVCPPEPRKGLKMFARRLDLSHSATRMAGVAVAAAIVHIVASCGLVQDRDTAQPAPAQPPSSTGSPSTLTEPIDTENWTIYTSDRYGFKVGHPPTWKEIPASRNFRLGADPPDVANPGLETFEAPTGFRVSVWKAPLDPGMRTDSTADIAAWVKEYCQSNTEPCSGIDDRAVELCVEKWDCHPGLLVPFTYDVQAFFTGGIYEADAMTVAAVWVGESEPAVARYGGSQRLLEAFLSTMQVWPASTPRDERE